MFDQEVEPKDCEICVATCKQSLYQWVTSTTFTKAKKPTPKLEVGMRVKWNDPGIYDYEPEEREWVLNRIFIIDEILGEDGDEDPMIRISEENGYSEAEVWAHELEIL